MRKTKLEELDVLNILIVTSYSLLGFQADKKVKVPTRGETV